MSKPPMSKVVLSNNYVKSYLCHKFWKPEAPPNLEEEEDITDKVVIVTGANAGIGREAAMQLAKRGAKVTLACRDLNKAKLAAEYITGKVPNAKIEIMKLDLGDIESIRSFVKEFESKYDRLNILVNNAGFMTTSGIIEKTKDGFEYHMGVNHLGPFLLTRLLLPSLNKGTPSRIVCVASSNISLSPLDLDDLMMEKGIKTGDDGMEPYNVSKLANALCIRHLASTLQKTSADENNPDKIQVYNLCPGFVKTEIFRTSNSGVSSWFRRLSLNVIGLTPAYGCETVVYCSVNKKLAQNPAFGHGEMHRFTSFYEAGTSFLDPEDPQAIKLYKISEELVGLSS